jgi:regulator of protease activity HflC (stomatin/prohibitin superfamily)
VKSEVAVQTTERPARWIHGVVGFVIFLVAGAVILAGFGASRPAKGVLIFCGVVAGVLAWRSMVVVRPNQAAVLTVFGHYGGTLRRAGWSAVNPFAVRVKLSLRIRTLDSDVLKVNDIDGNPIEVSAMVVWQVADTARAVFDVDDYNDFVALQTQAAIRHVTSRYPYDAPDEAPSLRSNADEVTTTMREELQDRLAAAGVTVLDVRLRRLAYAPEIAGDMLRRQQANAVVAARYRIVEGAVGMVEMALKRLAINDVIDLDEERKAQMAANLLVVLCGEQRAQPVLNTGSLYT